jgi:hypothetical protein
VSGVIPLALDTSLDAPRAAQKLVATPGLAAVVGPLLPADGFAAAPILRAQVWTAPYALTAEGFVAPDDPAWALALVQAAAEFARPQGATRLVVAGWAPDWPAIDSVAREGFAPLPAIIEESPDMLRPGDALLWVGSASDGARFISRLRSRMPELPVFVGSWLAADPVLVEHLRAASPSSALDALFAIGWQSDSATGDATSATGVPFTDHLIAAATAAALARSADRTNVPGLAVWRSLAPAGAWHPVLYRLDAGNAGSGAVDGTPVRWILDSEG